MNGGNPLEALNALSQQNVSRSELQHVFKEKESIFSHSLPEPFALYITDKAGNIISSLHSKNGLQATGEDLAAARTTVEIVLFAIAGRSDVYLQGDEPGLKNWAGWSGFACEITDRQKEVIGYFALYCKSEMLDARMFPFIRSIVSLLEDEMNVRTARKGTPFAEHLTEQLLRFHLTPRERQVAALWMMDYDYKEIGRTMGISENTVRVMTNRLNGKLQVKSKASMILRVLGAI
jgi:DNA-binding CsgD family transcriptional regulator